MRSFLRRLLREEHSCNTLWDDIILLLETHVAVILQIVGSRYSRIREQKKECQRWRRCLLVDESKLSRETHSDHLLQTVSCKESQRSFPSETFCARKIEQCRVVHHLSPQLTNTQPWFVWKNASGAQYNPFFKQQFHSGAPTELTACYFQFIILVSFFVV